MSGILQTSNATFNDVFKQIYEPAMANMVITESELKDLFTEVGGFEVSEGPDGKAINMSHIFSYGGGVGAMAEGDYIYASQDPDVKQSFLNIKQWGATVEMSGQTMRRAKEGAAAFTSWAQAILPAKVERLAFHQDRALYGAGTGILFQVNMATPASTALAINNAYGISGLEGATNLTWLGDGIRIAADAGGATLRTGSAVVRKTSFTAGTIDIDALPTSTATGDYVFLGDANVQGSGTKENMGLEGIVDDGTNVPTFQGLSRTTYPLMQARMINAATANSSAYQGVLSEDLLEYGDRISYEQGQGKCDVLLTSRSGRAVYLKNLRSDRRLNDPLSSGGYVGGIVSGGTKTGGPMMDFGDRKLELRTARKVPTSRSMLLQRSTLKMYRVGPGRWDDTTGSIWNRSTDSTGRKDAFYAAFVEEYNVACPRPVGNVKFTNLVAG